MAGEQVSTQAPADPAIPDADSVLYVRGISKVFPGLRALDAVDLDIRSGEVHGLCGGNGSGKSTLVKILSGVLRADSGKVRIAGRELEAHQIGPKLVRDLGVRVVHQDLALFPDLSVAENMMLGAGLPVSPVRSVQWRELRRRTRLNLDRFEITATPDALVRDLPIGVRSQVAIARALQDVSSGEGVLILDEPTAALPAHEVGLLLDAIRRLAAAGHAILFVSHRLDEVLAVTQRVTVFRDGRVFAEHRTAQLTESELIDSIIGQGQERRADTARSVPLPAAGAQPLLTIRNLSAGPLREVSLEVMPGEIVGVAGLLGSGRTELLRAVYGDLKRTAGMITVAGKAANYSRVDQAIAAGVVMIPEDRAGSGAFGDLTVDENLSLSVLREYWGLVFRRTQLRSDAEELRQRFRVRAASGSVTMKSLSGGNQQKTILARWLRRKPVLLLLDEPTQGVDVGARSDIHAAIRQVTKTGGAALLVLSDFEELAQVVDRAVVLRRGKITAHVPRERLAARHLNQLIYEETDNHA